MIKGDRESRAINPSVEQRFFQRHRGRHEQIGAGCSLSRSLGVATLWPSNFGVARPFFQIFGFGRLIVHVSAFSKRQRKQLIKFVLNSEDALLYRR